MALTTDSMSAADLAAITGSGRNNGFGTGDGFFYWIILFFFFMFGNNGWNGGNNGMNGLYPWMNQSNQMNNGFQNQMLYDNITGIRDGIYGVTAAVNNGFAQAEIAENSRQMAFMQQFFAMQQQFSQCCCDNRLATCQTQNIIQNEANQTRYADANNTQAIIQAIQSGDQKIMDKLCQLELDGYKQQIEAKNDIIAQLRQENLYSRGQASQVAQTAELRQSGATQLNQLVSELRSCPIPAQPVYGSQPIFTCGGNSYGCSSCGCGA